LQDNSANTQGINEASATLRQKMLEILGRNKSTTRELSKLISAPEKDIIRHMPHVMRSAAARGLHIKVQEAECLNCHFLFKERTRITRPGRCPMCKSTHIKEPSFQILEGKGSRSKKHNRRTGKF
jgi:predicted Zn-ribbon and HTH transcriptional regulator